MMRFAKQTELAAQQLITASFTLNKTDERRRECLLRLSLRLRKNPEIHYYMRLGEMPRSLWNNG